jgi:hypothetical protein
MGKIESVLGGNKAHRPSYINPSYHAGLGIRYKAGAGRSLQLLDSRKKCSFTMKNLLEVNLPLC